MGKGHRKDVPHVPEDEHAMIVTTKVLWNWLFVCCCKADWFDAVWQARVVCLCLCESAFSTVSQGLGITRLFYNRISSYQFAAHPSTLILYLYEDITEYKGRPRWVARYDRFLFTSALIPRPKIFLSEEQKGVLSAVVDEGKSIYLGFFSNDVSGNQVSE